jgi:DNA-binding NarL/FixJ family response regulator
VLILTTFDLDGYVYDALRAGASGFVLRDAAADDLLQAIRLIAAAEALGAAGLPAAVLESSSRSSSGPFQRREHVDDQLSQDVLLGQARASRNSRAAAVMRAAAPGTPFQCVCR